MYQICESQLEHVFSVMLPDSSEMRFLCDLFLPFMRINHIFFGNQFRNHLACSLPFLSEFFSSLWSGGVNTENKLLVLIGMSERVESLFWVV